MSIQPQPIEGELRVPHQGPLMIALGVILLMWLGWTIALPEWRRARGTKRKRPLDSSQAPGAEIKAPQAREPPVRRLRSLFDRKPAQYFSPEAAGMVLTKLSDGEPLPGKRLAKREASLAKPR